MRLQNKREKEDEKSRNPLYCCLWTSAVGGGRSRSGQAAAEGEVLSGAAGRAVQYGRRGKIQPEDRTPYPRVLMLNKEGEWVPAAAPIHFDKSFAGIGPGDAFAKLLAGSDPSITVGLIPGGVRRFEHSPLEAGRLLGADPEPSL